MKYILALILAAVLGSISFFIGGLAIDTIQALVAQPDNLGLWVGSVMTSGLALAFILATITAVYVEAFQE